MNILRKYYFVILVGISFLCCSTTCENHLGEPIYFAIENLCNDSIYVCDNILLKGSTFNNEDVFSYPKSYFKKIAPGETCNNFHLGFSKIYAEDIEDYYEPNSKHIHYVVIFKKSTLDKYSKEELIKSNFRDAIYMLTSKEIQDLGCVVRYPMDKD